MTKIKHTPFRTLHLWKAIIKLGPKLILMLLSKIAEIKRYFFYLQIKVIVKFANQEVAKSPFNVYVEGKVGDASKCHAAGPGIEPTGVVVDKPTWFEVDASSNFENISLLKSTFEL